MIGRSPNRLSELAGECLVNEGRCVAEADTSQSTSHRLPERYIPRRLSVPGDGVSDGVGPAPNRYALLIVRPMRFPVSLTYAETNETLEIQDHKLVFQLADVLNQINAEVDPAFQVNFIPWVQSNSA